MTDDIARIESTLLGWEHGILTIGLVISYGSSGQAIGRYALDKPVEKDGFVTRVGTAYGMEFVARVMKACGVKKWEDLKGRTILVVRNGPDRVAGIKPLPTEPGKAFMFDDLDLDFPLEPS